VARRGHEDFGAHTKSFGANLEESRIEPREYLDAASACSSMVASLGAPAALRARVGVS
jgi:hypothetical protein